MQGLDYQTVDSMAEYLHDEVLAAELQGQAQPEPAVATA
jgi:hypothetical protein